MADARLMVGVISSPEGAKFAEQIGAFVGHLGRSEPVDGVAARLLANFEQLVADLVDCAIPGEARPLPVDELHRIAQPPNAVHELAHRCALRAMRAAIDRGIPTWLLADPYPVQHLRGHRASDRAMRADALANGCACGERTCRCGFRLADAAERQRAQRGESATGNAGPAQECAAVEAAGLPGESLRERSAAVRAGTLALCSLDQHGRLPSTRITIDAVVRLDVIGFLIARLAFLVVVLAIGLRRPHQRRRQRRAGTGRADADLAKEIAATNLGFLFVPHRISPGPTAVGQLANVNASVSIFRNRRPSDPTDL